MPCSSPLKIGYLRLERNRRWAGTSDVYSALELAWKRSGRIFRWDGKRFFDELPAVLGCDILVLSYHHPGVISFLRDRMKFRGRFVIHSHGSGARGFPNSGDSLRILRERDLFICASRAEARAVRACLPNARVRAIPYGVSALWKPSHHCFPSVQCGPPILAFVGRISEQKNLHLLLTALAELRRRLGDDCPMLEIFGRQDYFGSPDMGIPPQPSRNNLKKWARALGIDDRVKWRGFLAPRKLRAELSARPHIFVSASLHSNEDFGLGALSSLLQGAPAVLSAWGGHLDFRLRFQNAVTLVPVYASPAGPFLSPFELADGIQRALLNKNFARRRAAANEVLTRWYGLESVAVQLRRAANACPRSDRPLVSSSLHRQLLRRRRIQGKSHLFSGYDDPWLWPLCSAYGMRPRARTMEPLNAKALWVPPWVCRNGDELLVEDPHRGTFRFRSRSAIAQMRWLVERGFAFNPASL